MKGYWNGESCDFEPVKYTVTQSETHTWWNNRFVGQRRQAIQITYQNQTWLIDNEHGDGYYKVTDGQGSPRVGHKSVSNPIDIEPIQYDEMNVRVDEKGILEEDKINDDYIKQSDPELYQKLESLKKAIYKEIKPIKK